MGVILTGKDSSVPGYSSVNFNISTALSVLHTLEARGFRYGLGCKVQSLDADSHTVLCNDVNNAYGGGLVTRIDCSGLARYLMSKSAGVVIPDGSYAQNDFLAAQGFSHHVITTPNSPDYLVNIDPHYLYMCFCKTGSRGETIGHVWYMYFTNNAWWTIESHGGVGPSSRLASTPILSHICTDIYPIAKIA